MVHLYYNFCDMIKIAVYCLNGPATTTRAELQWDLMGNGAVFHVFCIEKIRCILISICEGMAFNSHFWTLGANIWRLCFMCFLERGDKSYRIDWIIIEGNSWKGLFFSQSYTWFQYSLKRIVFCFNSFKDYVLGSL